MPTANEAFTDCLQRIRSEYTEIPGLTLTKPQVQRLWGLDPLECDAALDVLIAVKFLKRAPGAQYARADAGLMTSCRTPISRGVQCHE